MDNLFDQEAELAVLGACLISKECGNACDVVIPKLQAIDLFTTDHQLIYTAICSVYEKLETADAILVADELKQQGDLNRVGGPGYLYELQAPIVETKSTAFYVEIILEKSRLRNVVKLCNNINNEVANGNKADFVINNLLEKLESIQSAKDVSVIPVETFMQTEPPPTNWIVPELLPEGLTLLAGSAKAGKSFFCWNLALAVAQAGIALSTIAIPKAQVVTYLALDDSQRLLYERIDRLSRETSTFENLNLILDVGNMKFDRVGLRKLEKIIDDTKTKLLIVDTWNHVEPEIKSRGTSYQVDYDAMIPIRKLAYEKNMSIVLVTHTRKAPDPFNVWNEIQGSSGSQAGNDTMMLLKKDNGHSILHVVGRQVIQAEYAMLFDDGVWKIIGDAEEVVNLSERDQLREFLYDAGDEGLSLSELVDLTGKVKSTVNKLLRKMLQNDEIAQPVLRGNYYHKLFNTCE